MKILHIYTWTHAESHKISHTNASTFYYSYSFYHVSFDLEDSALPSWPGLQNFGYLAPSLQLCQQMPLVSVLEQWMFLWAPVSQLFCKVEKRFVEWKIISIRLWTLSVMLDWWQTDNETYVKSVNSNHAHNWFSYLNQVQRKQNF